MEFQTISDNKRTFLPLLLLGDEQEDMIERYLDRGTLYVLRDGGILRAVCVVTEEGGGTFEIKNLAVAPQSQRPWWILPPAPAGGGGSWPEPGTAR